MMSPFTLQAGFTVVLLASAGAIALPASAQDKVLRVGAQATDIATLDPHRTSSTHEKGPISWIFGGLVRFPPGSADPAKIEGDLAESWVRAPDGLTWTFKLRKGVQFHRGYGEATADDVVYSLARAADAKRSSFSSTFQQFDKVEALDSHTVRIRLKSPVPSLLGLVSNYHGGMIVSRKADQELGDGFKLKPVGFGPFEFVEHQTQRELTLKAHDKYYRGKPKIARIAYKFIASDASRDLAFSSGELDLSNGKREQRWVDRARQAAGAKVDVFGPGEYRTIFLNPRIKPLDDKRVREAVARAVDVPQLIKFVGADVTKPGRSVVPPGYLGESDSGAKYPHDIAKAKALLAEAGFPQGITIKATVSSNNAQQPVMEVVQGQLKRAGINLVMDVVDHTTYHAQIRKDVSALVFYGAARFPVADSYLTEFYHSASEIGAPKQVTNFSHCKVADEEIDAARREADPAKRLALWKSAQEKIHAEICGIPLFDLQQVWMRRDALDYGVKLEGAMNLAPPITELTTLK
ncbi:MAG TPA: ABC transporter substrate-binding protein [Usitatibacteraceae bacterium]|jgi:peptide/nickel transport system substrate-binding protein|nr:ABC transporter substrate-binding protein [Usitatibacteraceae bacterium]